MELRSLIVYIGLVLILRPILSRLLERIDQLHGAQRDIIIGLIIAALIGIGAGILPLTRWVRSYWQKPKVELSITGFIVLGNELPNPTLQLTVTANNTGTSTTLDGWRLIVHWQGRTYEGSYSVGREAATNSIDLGYLDEQVSATPLQGRRTGFVFFRSPIGGPQLLEAIQRRDGTMSFEIRAVDGTGREWSGRRSLVELANEGISQSTGTQPVRR